MPLHGFFTHICLSIELRDPNYFVDMCMSFAQLRKPFGTPASLSENSKQPRLRGQKKAGRPEKQLSMQKKALCERWTQPPSPVKAARWTLAFPIMKTFGGKETLCLVYTSHHPALQRLCSQAIICSMSGAQTLLQAARPLRVMP